MNLISFEASIQATENLLRSIDVLSKRGHKVIARDGVSDEFKKASYKSSYFNAYNAGIKNFDYDFLLADKSFFQFSFDLNNELPNVRYAFFQNPQEYISYEDFLNDLRRDELIGDESNEEIGDLYYDDYEQVLIEKQLNLASTTIRYDIDQASYRPLIHSVSHIHIGHINNIRIPCNKLLTPIKFSIFVVKHIYYHHWKRFLETGEEESLNLLRKAKSGCSSIEAKFWAVNEETELYLT